MKNDGGHFTPKFGGHFELESGGHFKLELGGQYHWNLQYLKPIYFFLKFFHNFTFMDVHILIYGCKLKSLKNWPTPKCKERLR
jgi:hypothetical protein